MMLSRGDLPPHSLKPSSGRDLLILTSNQRADLKTPRWLPFHSPAWYCRWLAHCGRVAHGHGSGSTEAQADSLPSDALTPVRRTPGRDELRTSCEPARGHHHSVENSQAPVVGLVLGEMQDVKRVYGVMDSLLYSQIVHH